MRIFGIVLIIVLLVYLLPAWLTFLYEVFEKSVKETVKKLNLINRQQLPSKPKSSSTDQLSNDNENEPDLQTAQDETDFDLNISIDENDF